MRTILMALVAVCMVGATAQAADDFATQKMKNWPDFRGPLGTGVAPEGNPPTEWSETKNIKWKLDIPGDSTGTPAIWNDTIFVTTAIKTDREGTPEPMDRTLSDGELQRIRSMRIAPPANVFQWKVMALERGTGKTKWEKMVKEGVPHEGIHPDGSYAATSPTTDGKFVYVSFGSRGIYCFDMAGTQIWARDLGKMNIFSTFGESISPVLHGNSLVVNWDHETGSFIVVLDAKTGDTIWKADRDEKTGWTTPLVVDYDGRSQVITYNKNFIRSYDLKTGDIIWQCHGKYTACIPVPVTDHNLVFVMTGYMGYELLAIPLTAKGDITGTDTIAWEKTKGTPYCPSPLLYDGKLWFTQENTAILSVLQAKTGDEVISRERLQGLKNIYASPVAAAGKIYITGRDGVTLVLKNDSKVEVLATNKLDDGVDASAAIVGKELYIRGRKSLYCISE